MSTAEKELSKMRNNPRDWRIEQLESVAARYGIIVRSGKGSHRVFTHQLTDQDLTVPARNPVKPIYVKSLVAMIDTIIGGALL